MHDDYHYTRAYINRLASRSNKMYDTIRSAARLYVMRGCTLSVKCSAGLSLNVVVVNIHHMHDHHHHALIHIVLCCVQLGVKQCTGGRHRQ